MKETKVYKSHKAWLRGKPDAIIGGNGVRKEERVNVLLGTPMPARPRIAPPSVRPVRRPMHPIKRFFVNAPQFGVRMWKGGQPRHREFFGPCPIT